MVLFLPLQFFCFHPTTFLACLHLDRKDSIQTQQCTEIIWLKLSKLPVKSQEPEKPFLLPFFPWEDSLRSTEA